MSAEEFLKEKLIKKIIQQRKEIKELEKTKRDLTTSKNAFSTNIKELNSLINTSAVGILIINKDGTISSVNDELLRFSGQNKEALLGKYFTEKISLSGKNSANFAKILTALLNGEEVDSFLIRQKHKDGRIFYGQVYISSLKNDKEKVTGFKIMVKDITALKETENELKLAEEKFYRLFNFTHDGMVLHKAGKILAVNKSFRSIFNCSPEYPLGKNFLEFIAPEFHNLIRSKIASGYDESFEINGLNNNGDHIRLKISGYQFNENKKLRVEVLSNINEFKKAEKRIRYLSFHDSLTELYNRTYFEKVLSSSSNRELPLTFIICDLNGLKVVNETFGNEEGDKLLKRVATILKYCAREEDVIARWGGDEFFILMPRSSEKQAEEIAKKIRKICSRTNDQKIPLNLSLGISVKKSSGQLYRDVIKEAEDNMNKNKLLERNSIYGSIISSLEKILWEKSHETREHAERLKTLILRLGKAINLPTHKLDELILLSTLHDIGKVGVPDDILMKKGELDDQEWRIIKRHPEIGYNIAKSTPQIATIAEDILSHHEWWDGSGYPQGLKGEQIPINSCITSIVDAYDVMTMGRPYREPVSSRQARDELLRCAGTQFNPGLVEKFVVL